MRALALALLLCLVSSSAWAIKYVCADGANTGTKDGNSLATCWDGVKASAVAGSLFANMGSVAAGETIYVCGEFTPSMVRWVINGSGTAGNVIWLDGDKTACGRTENSTISREGLTGTNGRAISATGKSYIGFRNLTISNCDQYCISWDYTSAVTENTHLYIDNVDFSYCTGTTAPGDCIWKRGVGLTVTDSTFDHCWEDCIWTRGKDVSVSNNRFTNISYGNALGDATQIDLTTITDSGYSRWFNNYADHQDADNKYGFVIGPTVGAGSSVSVYGNTVLCPLVPTNPTPASQCHPIYLDTAAATAVDVHGNFTQGGEVGISITAASAATFSTRALVYGNVVYNASDRGIWTDSNVDNISVYHNTISNAGQEALYIGKSGATMDVSNNIFADSAIGLFYITAPTSRGYNGYFGNTQDINVNGSGGSQTTGDSSADPAFVGAEDPTSAGAFCLGISSTLRGAGTNLGVYQLDHYGRGFTNPPPMGAMSSCEGRPPATSRPVATTRVPN